MQDTPGSSNITPDMELELLNRLGIDRYLAVVVTSFFPLPFRIRYIRF